MAIPRILIVRGGAIGDFIMTLPAIGALREQWPDAHIEILGYPHITELARQRYYADATRSIEARAMAGFFIPNAILDPGLMEYFASFGLVVSYLFDPDRVFAENVLRCGVKQLIEGSPRPHDLPAAVHYCKPLEQVAVYVDNPQARVFPSDADREFAAGFLSRTRPQRLVALHVGSGSPRKNWPAARFAELACWLIDAHQQELLVVAGEADTEALARFDEQLGGRPYHRASGLNLVQVAAVLERCRAYVGNDSGVTHLAVAVRTPTVALFGPASPAIWQPRGERVQIVPFGPAAAIEVRAVLNRWLRLDSC